MFSELKAKVKPETELTLIAKQANLISQIANDLCSYDCCSFFLIKASRMVFQVLINFNEKKNKPLRVADSEEEFNNTTVRELKEKFKSQIPGAPGRLNIDYFPERKQIQV